MVKLLSHQNWNWTINIFWSLLINNTSHFDKVYLTLFGSLLTARNNEILASSLRRYLDVIEITATKRNASLGMSIVRAKWNEYQNVCFAIVHLPQRTQQKNRPNYVNLKYAWNENRLWRAFFSTIQLYLWHTKLMMKKKEKNKFHNCFRKKKKTYSMAVRKMNTKPIPIAKHPHLRFCLVPFFIKYSNSLIKQHAHHSIQKPTQNMRTEVWY